MTDNEIIKAFDILDKFEFFGGQRAGRELWFNKPADIQEKDIGKFLRDLDFLKQFINRQKAEIARLEKEVGKEFTCFVGDPHKVEHCPYLEELQAAKAEAIKEFAERLKEPFETYSDAEEADALYMVSLIDLLVKEMTGEQGGE